MIGNDGGLDVTWDQGKTWEYVSTMATALAYCGLRRHAPSVLRLHRPAGQRQLGRPERVAQPRRDPELRLVRHRRRRRFLHGGRSDRLQHGLHRVAGRQHEPLRPRGKAGGRASVRSRRRVRGGAAAAGRLRPRRRAERDQRAAGRRVPVQLEHAGHACRRTTRRSCGSAATGCSSRTTRATPGSRAPTSRNRSTAARSR